MTDLQEQASDRDPVTLAGVVFSPTGVDIQPDGSSVHLTVNQPHKAGGPSTGLVGVFQLSITDETNGLEIVLPVVFRHAAPGDRPHRDAEYETTVHFPDDMAAACKSDGVLVNAPNAAETAQRLGIDCNGRTAAQFVAMLADRITPENLGYIKAVLAHFDSMGDGVIARLATQPKRALKARKEPANVTRTFFDGIDGVGRSEMVRRMLGQNEIALAQQREATYKRIFELQDRFEAQARIAQSNPILAKTWAKNIRTERKRLRRVGEVEKMDTQFSAMGTRHRQIAETFKAARDMLAKEADPKSGVLGIGRRDWDPVRAHEIVAGLDRYLKTVTESFDAALDVNVATDRKLFEQRDDYNEKHRAGAMRVVQGGLSR